MQGVGTKSPCPNAQRERVSTARRAAPDTVVEQAVDSHIQDRVSALGGDHETGQRSVLPILDVGKEIADTIRPLSTLLPSRIFQRT